MNRKTISKSLRCLVIIAVVMLAMLTLSSCGECTEHTFDNGCDTSCNNEGCAYTRETSHVYDHDCDGECNECGQTRETSHVYDNECDGDCSVPGCGATRPTEHKFDHGCDGECNVCGQTRETKHIYAHDCDKECRVTGCGYVRETQHVFDNDCDESCNTARCGYVRETEHKYDSACDGECNVCGFDRTVKHEFDNVCDTVCNVEGCGYEREASHLFDHECDSECNTEGCGYTRETQHIYDHDCDKKCNVEGCGYVRETEHKYDNACDGICNVVGCGATRPTEHKYDHACDGDCNECGYERKVNHLYSHGCDPDCNTAECDFVRTVEHIYAHSLDKDCETPECSETREIGKQAVLLIGQSNMVGIGDVTTVAPVRDPRLTMMRGDKWVTFMEPLHTNSTRAGIGLGGSFAKAFVETFDVELGVIPAAEGATTLEMWAVGGRLYNEAVRLCKIAQQDSEICAILWHQGEGDQNNPNYAALLRVILDSMLEDLGLEKDKIIIVTGELFGNRSDAVHRPQLNLLAKHYPNYAIAESDGLTVVDVTTHFDAQSLRVFGYRYFDKFYNLKTGGKYEFIDDPNHYYIAEDENADYSVEENFNYMPTGPLYTMNGHLISSPMEGSVSVVEQTSTEKYVTIASGFKENEGVFGSAYVDIFGSSMVGETVVMEAKFKLSMSPSAPADIFKVLDVNNKAYTALRLGADGKLYNMTANVGGVQQCLNRDFDLMEWTTVKVVMDFANNLKDVYVGKDLVLDNVPISKTAPGDVQVLKNRLVHYVNNQSIGGSVDVDDYKFYIYDGDLLEKEEGVLAQFNFNSLPTGKATTQPNVIYFSPFIGGIEIVEAAAGEKYLSSYNSLKDDGNYSSNYTDIFATSPVGGYASSTMKLKLGKNFAASIDLFKLIDKNNGAYCTVRVEPDGKLYSMTDSQKTYIGYSLSEKHWTEVTVIFNLEKNEKVILVDGTPAGGITQISSKAAYKPVDMVKVRITHFQQVATGGTLYVDDYVYKLEDGLTKAPEYISKQDFNEKPTGKAVNESKVIEYAPFIGFIEIVEGENGEKYLSSYNSLKDDGNYSSSFVDIYGVSSVDADVRVTMKLKLGKNFAASIDLFKLIDKNNGAYYTVRVEPDGKLYSMTDTQKTYIGYSLSEEKWTEVSLIFNLEKNEKVILVEGVQAGIKTQISAKPTYNPADMLKVRITHFQQIATGGTLYVDDYVYMLEQSSDDSEGEDENSYLVNESFEGMSVGAAKDSDGYFTVSSIGKSEIYSNANGKYLGTYNETTDGTSYGTSFVDIVGRTGFNSVVTMEAKFKLGENYNARTDLLKLFTENNSGYISFRVETDGTVYAYVHGLSESAVVGKLTTDSWVTLKVVYDLKNNKKDIYFNDVKVIEGMKISSGNIVESPVWKARVIHVLQSATTGFGKVYMDDYKVTVE